MHLRRRPSVVLALAALAALAAPVGAVDCPVPSATHPTIQAAVDDAACTAITLGTRTYAESVVIGRDLSLAGVSSGTTLLRGQIRVTAGAVSLGSMRVEPLWAAVALEVSGGAEVDAFDVLAVLHVPVFADGFETGDCDAWSADVP